MVDALNYDEGEGWDAAPSMASSSAPHMAMQSQEEAGYDDPFASESVTFSTPQVTIQTASGAAQNLDDDLTEEEKEIVRQATEH
jgi:hypothetical protein